MDCGSQQTFTCSVYGSASWTFSGLSGIRVPRFPTGVEIAKNNSRITTTDTSGLTPSSTINITGFTTTDNGATIQCFEHANASVQGMASISVGEILLRKSMIGYPDTQLHEHTVYHNSFMVLSMLNKSTEFFILGPPSCSANVTSFRIDDFTRTNVTWQQPPKTPPVTSTTVTYCPTSSPNCGNSMTCTSPCTISGLDPCVDYNVTITPTNNCGSATGCNGSMVSAKGYNLGVYTV